MESIKELRRICQAERRPYDTWHGIYIARPISIYITIVFLKLGISANAATGIFLAVGVIGSVLLAFGDRGLFFAGALFLQLWYLIDHVDGEIARYKKQSTFTGVYFDKICHYIVHPLIFLCIGLGIYLREQSIVFFLTSLLAGYSIIMISLASDVSNSILYEKLKGICPVTTSVTHANNSDGTGKKNIFLKSFSLIHFLCTFPNVVDIIFLASLLEFFTKLDLIKPLVVFFAISATLVWAARFVMFIAKKKADVEYLRLSNSSK
jgi:phosphatidylglycerophosphate synthase